ncbi:hypothetical protein AK812_SmicGene3199 [Symbiodinium microadriaticum]|uniref:Uncharacterized protein n=1 Tax=Symbiodinium microadriaticum TaxID=2951 RepID=A0A1Q9EZP0_SYMMI|nr:hypothetical protein AK812_SmicGene3199 [Symbiodinium microadriaticum]CAE7567435.1 unnamed protein product [Symbiodinium microadriaticum]CAE7947147.1 unnamed protein product [Symbiodinium sp. KB8]
MSAQQSATVPNGVGTGEVPAQPAQEGGCNPSQQRIGGDTGDEQQPFASEASRDDMEQPRVQIQNPGESVSVMQTDSTPQVGQPYVSTMVDRARRSLPGQSDLGQQAEEPPVGYVTPRSTTSMRPAPQTTWLTGVEFPKWMARLGSILQHPGTGIAPAELAPSPYPSGSSMCSPPPGGPAFRLRSPAKARAIPATPTPPSSSSIPAEAIQAEVQRQLQGVLGQLREYGETNQRLHAELLETRARLREEQAGVSQTDGPGVQQLQELQMQAMTKVEMIYERWLAASPLERLNIEPVDTDEWTTGRWARVNARAATMILTALPEQLRLDMVARRAAQNCVKMMFRAYTHYQPGGGAERHDVLRRLQNPVEFTGGDSLAQVLQTLRAWPRWMERCRRVQMVPPDPTVLARGLMGLTDKYISSSTDANFRTAMLRTTLRLDARPTTEQVTAYQRHLQAELETMLASQAGVTGGQLQPKLRAVEQATVSKARDGGSKAAGSPDLCRYFAKASGCKRGDKCSYSHSMSSMEKDVRARKCLKCGAESHRQKDCPVGRSATKGSTQPKDYEAAGHTDLRYKSEEEWNEATEVAVQLAGSYSLVMRITASGTLLMPYKGGGTNDALEESRPQTIVPMGQLIQTLGYTMVWSKNSCYLESQEGERVPLQVTGGCPQLQEMEALTLIARLEDRKMEELSNSIITTKDKLQLSALSMERTWEYYLMDYILTGSFESGLRAVRDAPFFADLPGECLQEMIPTNGLWAGWDILKEIGFLNRPQKRKLLNAKRWVVHLFAGKEGHGELMKLDQGDVTVIELDLARCKGQDILRDETWRMLLWGAKEGKIDVILGGPPARSLQKGGGGERDIKSVAWVARMMWLHAVSQVGREVNGTPRSKNRDVGFVLEYPEGPSRAAREAQERLIQEREDELQDHRGRGGVASWNYANWYWEHVQRPRFEQYAGRATMDGNVSFWNTRLWKSYQRESGLRTISFDQGAMGSATRNRTTIATNVNNLMGLDELRVPEDDERPESGSDDSTWAPGLVEALVVSLSFWDRDPHAIPQLRALTPEQWKQHVESNHAVYRKECATCVTARGTGRQHRRVHHPESYVLTADIAGPLAKGLDPTSKGTMGKNLKYLLVAKYIVPKEYVQLHSGAFPPEDDGCVRDPPSGDQASMDEEERLLKELFGEEEGEAVEDLQKPVEVIQIPGDSTPIQYDEASELAEYEPSIQEEDDGDPEQENGDLAQEPQDQVMTNGDCVPPDLTYLMFAVGLENNQSATVRRALQDIVMYLQMHSFPIYRFHADKGEFFNHQLRNWLRDHCIYATWSEPGIPQGNGHAEGAVRWTKDRIRTLLQGASLPTKLWPVAAATAAAQQRAKVLGWRSYLAAPFGATVHLKRKAFDEKGPQRRENALESKWTRGRYVGLSTILHHGHIVYVPAEGEDREKFFHTAHVRPNLIDPGEPDAELVAEPPKPKRRLVEKSRIEEVEMRVMEVPSDVVKQWAKEESKELLENWSYDGAKKLVTKLAKAMFFTDKKFGVHRHGGSVGWMKGMQEYPDLVRLLTRLITEADPTATFTSVLVSYNTQKSLHKDFNNDPRTYNYVVPIQVPSSGGELWTELKPGDYVKGPIEQRTKGERQLYGQCLQLEEDKAIKVGPMSAHEVCHWEGERIVVIGYSPQCLGKLTQEDVSLLHEYGFPIPLSQLPEYYENEEAEAIHLRKLSLGSEEESDNDTEHPAWTMYLDLGPGLARITDSTKLPRELPQVQKTEVVYTADIENVLATLSGPLDVTYTVNPADVMKCLDRWKPAIEKELKSIEVAIERLSPGSEARKRWLSKTGVQRLPTKFVFTVKPNDQADESDPLTWFKRKARLVVCGNMAAEDGTAVYTETAPAESVRAGLTLAMRYLGDIESNLPGFQLRIRWEQNSLVMFCDAAYAPQNARSHGGWLVTYGGSPIMWRSGKQTMITLSTAEAELLAIIDGAIAIKGVEALLVDMGMFVDEKQIASDSTANWIQEQVKYGQFTTVHCPGERWMLIEFYQEWTPGAGVIIYVVILYAVEERFAKAYKEGSYKAYDTEALNQESTVAIAFYVFAE